MPRSARNQFFGVSDNKLPGDASRKRIDLEPIWPLSCVLVAWLLYAGPLLSTSTNLYLSDTGLHDLPCRIHAAQLIREGQFPHWCPLLHCGIPLYAENQTGITYPLFLLYVISPTPEMHDIYMAVHYLLAGVFMYCFVRQLAASPVAAAAAGITFMTSAQLQSTHVVPGFLSAATWIPLALLLHTRFAAGNRWAMWCCCLVNATIMLAGHIHIALIAFSIQACYLLFFSSRLGWRSLCQAMLVTLVLPIAVAGIQFMPLFEFVWHSNRTEGLSSKLSWEHFSMIRIHPEMLLTFFNPTLMGAPDSFQHVVMWESSLVCFHGFAAIFLLPTGVVWGQPRRQVVFWGLMLLLGILLATGSPLLRVLYYMPVYSMFRAPSHYTLVASVATCVLVGFGTDAILRRLGRSRSLPWQGRRVGQFALPVLVILGMNHSMAPFLTSSSFYEIGSELITTAAQEEKHFRLLPTVEAIYMCYDASDRQMRANAMFLPASHNLLYGIPVATLFDQEVR